jgi:hypothetical protein
VVTESGADYESYPIVPRPTDPPAGKKAAIGFWNLGDADTRISVNGQPHALAKGQHLTLSLGRQFNWKIEGRESHEEKVPDASPGVEIVIRR